ncbi:protein of unknown function DUF265 [Methanocaldococcus sp. FS406-22]|uniref:NTPase n=1 Tax=Methanocaldococcus sp. (strain FS406-22) TaxID=644281 RepID=UPI0001BF576E|nr:NTPase [Methanocaldococcus sp. FS406-22]ADC69415.1 protein of unknown function DUF265 [Methanocaldococcus sp. FS406-22]
MKIFITGMPGVGKTTLALKIAEKLKDFGYKVGGFITKEIRKNGKRVGFKIITLDTNEEAILAYVGDGNVKVGKYVVFVENLDKVGVEAIKRALKDADIIIIDELGAMEFKSKTFSKVVDEVINNNKPLLATLHRNWVNKFKNKGKIYRLSIENRNKLYKEILDEILSYLQIANDSSN